MSSQEMIALPCPACGEPIYRPLAWFRRTYGTCPHCGGGLSAEQFAPLVSAAEQAFDDHIDEMLGVSAQGCSGCGGGHCHPPASPREVGDEG